MVDELKPKIHKNEHNYFLSFFQDMFLVEVNIVFIGSNMSQPVRTESLLSSTIVDRAN